MNDLTVLVVGYDDWAVTWIGFCYYWKKFWPDCPWSLRFMSNQRTPPCGEPLFCGSDTNWTAMMRNAMREIETPYMLLMLSDYWLSYPVEAETIFAFANHLRDDGIGHIRLQQSTPLAQGSSGRYERDERLFKLADTSEYRICLQSALWNCQVFADLLYQRETPWEFETRASIRSRGHVKALAVNRNTTPDQWNNQAYFCYHNMVSQGQWCGKPINDALEPDVRQWIESFP